MSKHKEADLEQDATWMALRELADHFRVFARIGRWGSCAACPRSPLGDRYPEFCEFKDRYDHQLSVDELAATYNRYRDAAKREQRGRGGVR